MAAEWIPELARLRFVRALRAAYFAVTLLACSAIALREEEFMAIPDEIPQGSKEYLSVVFDSPDDLTSGTVVLGLSSDPSIQPASWLPAGWPTSGVNEAQSSDVFDFGTVDRGFYQVWARITDTPEIIPRPYGTVRVV